MNMLEKYISCLIVDGYQHVENDASYAVGRNGDTLTIYFEWSNGKKDWKHNFMFPAKPYRKMENLWFCHRGFLKVWKSIEKHISTEILDPTVKNIDIVGYSHGGAIAQLCYEYVKFNRPDVKATGLGFGAPRIFWGPAGKKVKERFEGFLVVRNRSDLITRLPPAIFGFHHICKILRIGDRKSSIGDHYPEEYMKSLKDYDDYHEIGSRV